jgi:Zn-dependent membrane protease YugP
VETTDLGDHYDPKARAVRLSRDRFDRKSLTAFATAAHEVAHAIQHHSRYGPFVWRLRLTKAAQVISKAGIVLLLSVPIARMMGRQPLPPVAVGSTLLTMLGTGVAIQMTALPAELDASFGRALPLLRDGYIDDDQVKQVRKVLVACSLTYIASSLVSVLYIWPWYGRRSAVYGLLPVPLTGDASSDPVTGCDQSSSPDPQKRIHTVHSVRHVPQGTTEKLMRRFGKPVIRSWLRVRSSL